MPILGGCCCFDLKVGTKIIAVLKLISSIFSFITLGSLLLFMILTGDLLRETIKEEQARNEMLSATPPRDTRYRDPTSHFPRDREFNERFDEDFYDEIYSDYSRKQVNNLLNLISENLGAVKILLLEVCVVSIVNTITSSFLVHGINQSRRGLFLPWLLVHWLELAVDFLLIVVIIVGGVIFNLPAAIYITFALMSLIGWLFYTYFVLVVTSQYQAMGLIILREDDMSLK